MYGQSKLTNRLYVRELAKRLQGTTTTANSVHPGVIFTNPQQALSEVADLFLAKA